MATQPKKVLLRDTESGQTHPFNPGHAKRLLALPGTLWEEVAEGEAEVSGDGSGQALPEADSTEKLGAGVADVASSEPEAETAPATTTSKRKAAAQ